MAESPPSAATSRPGARKPRLPAHLDLKVHAVAKSMMIHEPRGREELNILGLVERHADGDAHGTRRRDIPKRLDAFLGMIEPRKTILSPLGNMHPQNGFRLRRDSTP